LAPNMKTTICCKLDCIPRGGYAYFA